MKRLLNVVMIQYDEANRRSHGRTTNHTVKGDVGEAVLWAKYLLLFCFLISEAS